MISISTLALSLLLSMQSPQSAPGVTLPVIHYVIPHVIVGADVVVMNSDVMDMDVKIAFAESVRFYRMTRRSVLHQRALQAGYVLISASSNHIAAWSVVEGAVFPAQKLDTQVRDVILDRRSGLAVANPWPSDKRITLWVYRRDGTFIRLVNLIVRGGETRVDWAAAWIPDMKDDEYYVQLVGGPFGVGVARWTGTRWEGVPVNSIKFDPLSGPGG